MTKNKEGHCECALQWLEECATNDFDPAYDGAHITFCFDIYNVLCLQKKNAESMNSRLQ
eukprot:CAMPEP_0195518216 /NCGR_PEP_ID=MMETSP0794_2-20130614/12591_1 /TAXON_ID=515487 /ORGANISM="Stephanopyxis turris, Strain CCMP 815" /LENGTH=58 /DNA_ID=CAMNT_0040647145 /DNA_START=194 /DNA_END=368 /DNA_ORIENTATION=+